MTCSLRINVQRGQYCNDMRLMNSERFFAWPLFSTKKTNPVWNDSIIGHWVKLSTKYTHRTNLQYSFPCFVRAQSASCCAPAPLLPGYYWFLRDHLKTNLFLTITGIRAAKHLPVTTFWLERVLRFVTEYAWISQLLRNAAFFWQPGNKFLQFSDLDVIWILYTF